MKNDCQIDSSVRSIITKTTPLKTVSTIGVPITKRTMENLSINKERLQIWNNWVKIDNEYFYYKGINYIYTFLEELLGEQISKYFDLNTVHYEIAKRTFKNSKLICYGLLSKNFRLKNKRYLEGSDLHLSKYSNFDLFYHLEEYNENGVYDLLISDLKKMLIRDFYTNQKDRMTDNNFFFQVDNGKIRLSPLHDYEYSFEEVSSKYTNLFASFDLHDTKVIDFFQKDKEFYFLIQKILLLDMKKILENIEQIYQLEISTYHKNHYIHYDEQVKENILKLGI